MSMQKARNLAKALLISALVLMGGSILMQADSRLSLALLLVGVALCAAGIYVTLVLCSCPHCGRSFFFGALSRLNCPYCGKKLTARGKR